ncbi:hypothetical protein RR48_11632, partial [Papilio machaon]
LCSADSERAQELGAAVDSSPPRGAFDLRDPAHFPPMRAPHHAPHHAPPPPTPRRSPRPQTRPPHPDPDLDLDHRTNTNNTVLLSLQFLINTKKSYTH